MNTLQSRRALMRQARERYEHPLEVEAYAAQVAGGLTAEEQAILQQYVPQPCRVLDIGCGAGREAISLTKQGYRVVATDISRSMLRAARTLSAEFAVEIAYVWMSDPLKLPVPHQAFDCALGFAQLLSHIPGHANRVEFLQEVSRALAPNGLLVATVTDRQAAADLCGDNDEELAPLLQAAGWETGDVWVWQPSEAHLDTPLFFHLHTEEEIRDELAAAHLRMVAFIPGNELATNPDPDAGRYRYIVARKEA